MDVTSDAINGRNFVQGGAIYTLADFTFAGASNSFGTQAVTMNSSISYIRPGTGSKLYAEAKAVNKGHKTGVFSIRVTDSRKRLIAVVTSTAFFTDQPCEEMYKDWDPGKTEQTDAGEKHEEI